MNPIDSGYGLWALAVLNAAFFIFFAWSFYTPLTTRDWRSFGLYSAFVVALFAEMYGFPLTIYLLGHFAGLRVGLDHVSGHLLGDLITWMGLGNGWAIVMILSNLLIVAGIWVVSAGWEQVYHAGDGFVTSGLYARMRHPQYTGIFIITLGFMIQWPTLATLILWPFVVIMYVRLARREEAQMLARFPDDYRAYMARTPMFVPRLFGSGRPAHAIAKEGSRS